MVPGNNPHLSESAVTGGVVTELISAASIAWDARGSFAAKITLDGDYKFENPTNLLSGVFYTLAVTQGAGGTHVPTFGTAFRFPNLVNNQSASPFALSTAEGAVDILLFYCDDDRLNLVSVAQDESAGIAAPSDLTATNGGIEEVILNWVNNQTVDVTAVFIQRDDGIGFSTIASVGPTDTTYTDAFLTPATYTYRVIAAHNAGPFSPPSNVVTGTPVLAPPTDLTASTDETGRVTLNWVNHSGVQDGVAIQRDDGSGFVTIVTISPIAVSWPDIVAPGTYPYRVCAAYGPDLSAPSNTAIGVSN